MVGACSGRIWVFGVALLLSVLFLGVMVPAYAEEYVFITKWGSQGSGDGEFNHPYGVAVDASGNVYLADTGNDRVQKFGPFAFTIESSDVAGNVKNVFDIRDIVYVNGSGYSASTTHDLYIVEDQATWTDGMPIPTRVPGTATDVTSDDSGNISPSAVWSPPLTPGDYDIVVDVNGNGAYNVGVDALDTQTTAGFIVIPEFPSFLILPLFMIATLLTVIVHRRKCTM